MIIAGDMDENVHPASSLSLVDKLIKANKDFELLIIPNADHTLVGHGYFIRKMLDFLVKNLIGKIPPKEYNFWSPLS